MVQRGSRNGVITLFHKFSDMWARASNVDPDQTAPRGAPRGAVLPESALFAIPLVSFESFLYSKVHVFEFSGDNTIF